MESATPATSGRDTNTAAPENRGTLTGCVKFVLFLILDIL